MGVIDVAVAGDEGDVGEGEMMGILLLLLGVAPGFPVNMVPPPSVFVSALPGILGVLLLLSGGCRVVGVRVSVVDGMGGTSGFPMLGVGAVGPFGPVPPSTAEVGGGTMVVGVGIADEAVVVVKDVTLPPPPPTSGGKNNAPSPSGNVSTPKA